VDKNVAARHLQTAKSLQTLGQTVLVVEDDAPVRAIIRTMLERRGLKVLEAASGIDALAIWHQHHETIQLLLTDLVLPSGISGEELSGQFPRAKTFASRSLHQRLQPWRGDERISTDHAQAFLEKPFDGTKLIEAVHRCLESAAA
jgi:CheY-like chemotaxis protein